MIGGALLMHRVLVVDEDRNSRQHTSTVLRDLNCRVQAVSDPVLALSQLRHSRFDGVLFSDHMPHMSAAAFIDRLRTDEQLADVRVVAVAVTPRAAIDAIRSGARGCIRKPVDVGSLVSAWPALLGGYAQPKKRRRRTGQR
jgi:CheY-like chemotaxis protein